MQFFSNRSVNFQINIGGQPFVVMFGDSNIVGQCSFVTRNEKVADAIRRHSFFKKGIVWEKPEEPVTTGVNNEKPADDGVLMEEPGENSAAIIAEAPGITEQDTTTEEDEVPTFENFTEAKDWFCKKYGVAKTTVRNPTALNSEASARGIKIQYRA